MGRQQLKKRASDVASSQAASQQGPPASKKFVPTKEQLRGAVVDKGPVRGDNKVHFYLLGFCASLEPYGPPFADEPGMSVRMMCGTRPSPIFDFKRVLSQYCENVAASQDWPASYEELEEFLRFKFAYSDGRDLDETNLFKKNAVTCYMPALAEVFQEWFITLEDFFSWRANESPFELRCDLPTIVVHNVAGLTLDLKDDKSFTCPVEILEASDPACRDGAVTITDVPPPVYPKRMVIWQLATCTETAVDLTILGNCRPFASALNEANVACKQLKRDVSDQYFEKFYVLHDYDLSTEEKRNFILQKLMTEIFRKVPIVLRIDGPLKGKGEALRLALEALDNVFPC